MAAPSSNAAAAAKKKSFLQNIFSLSTLSSAAALFYVYFAFSNLLNLMYPLRNIPLDVLSSIPNERKVFPFWDWKQKSAKQAELGLRVYLSAEPNFSLDFFAENDDFIADEEDPRDDAAATPKTINNGNSFLLWSEDDALKATTSFPSRSFVLVSGDESSPRTCEGGTNNVDEQMCTSAQQTSQDFAHQWLEDSIKHEKQLQSDGGGIMAAMNSAGGGIESTSVLLTVYTSLTKTAKRLVDNVVQSISGGSSTDTTEDSKQSAQKDETEPKSIIRINQNNPVWQSIMSNGTAYVHVLLVRQTPAFISSSLDPRTAATRVQQLHSQHNVLFGRVSMMKRDLPLHVPSPKRLLYRDILFAIKKFGLCKVWDDGSCSSMVAPWNIGYHQPQEQADYQLAQQHKKEGVAYPYWKPEVRIHLIQEEEGYPIEYANNVGFEVIRLARGDGQHSSGYAYLPSVHVDEIGLTSDKYIPLNETVTALPLRIGFHGGMETGKDTQSQEGITPARYRLLNHLSAALESQAEMGFEQSDIDDLRRLIAETNVVLLAITILASVLHLLFEFLTFKNDVDFWKSNTDLTGLSVRALWLDWMSQVVILLYLIEMDSSLLMTIPTGVGMVIALWKCQRGAGLKFVKFSAGEREKKAWYQSVFCVFGYELRATRLRAAADNTSESGSNENDLAALTEEMDQIATSVLGKYFLLPLVTTYAIYSLMKENHSGWYSWFITTASSFVYAIGFVLMTPQLFLNYKLKSVAHLPWRVLGYRFVNTFIDDLFAFIIRMPTMARMSCFRDDVVFFVYLWQRYLYPVDTSRPVEGGGVAETDAVQEKEKGTKQKQS
ncbi:CLPTM1 family protein [Skeletonema marinoi]|uniref:CLPTM1 family protein n=1 Tax=Skeletonema marinoi TaxID=267567 RepID=A0AAD9DGT0_9STRA|nr:CLPTM1 family protein [Skeletonema marinoi]